MLKRFSVGFINHQKYTWPAMRKVYQFAYLKIKCLDPGSKYLKNYLLKDFLDLIKKKIINIINNLNRSEYPEQSKKCQNLPGTNK